MTVSLKTIDPVSLSTASTDVYETPANTKAREVILSFHNRNTTTARVVTITATPSGGSAIQVDKFSLAAEETYTASALVGYIMDSGDTLAATIDAGSDVTFYGGAVEVTV